VYVYIYVHTTETAGAGKIYTELTVGRYPCPQAFLLS